MNTAPIKQKAQEYFLEKGITDYNIIVDEPKSSDEYFIVQLNAVSKIDSTKSFQQHFLVSKYTLTVTADIVNLMEHVINANLKSLVRQIEGAK
jgi:hypothetical protein